MASLPPPLAAIWALQLDGPMLCVIAGIAVALLAVIWFGLRYWLAATRPPSIQDIPTPALDRLNQQALEHMAQESQQQDEAETRSLENEEAPADLKAVIPLTENTPK